MSDDSDEDDDLDYWCQVADEAYAEWIESEDEQPEGDDA